MQQADDGRDGGKRIVIAGGGTGGHLFPALAVAGELRARHPAADIRFLGATRGLEVELVPRAGYPLRTLPLGALKGQSALARVRSVVAAGLAVTRTVAWMLRRRPSLVIGVGGYASGPGVLAARLLRVRTMVLEQNHFPGATNRWLAPRVDAVCVPSRAAARRLRGRLWVTGNPVRAEFFEIGEPPAAAEPSILVFGGSRGARSINRAMAATLPRLATLATPPRIVHQTGPADEPEVRAAYERDYAGRPWEVHAFLDDMPARFAAADLIVARAGATTVAELAAAGRASILVPYPHAADDHQRHNAEALAEAGAAVVVPDAELPGGRLADEIVGLAADRERMLGLGQAARSLAAPDATRRIADLADALLDGRDPAPARNEEDADVP